MAETLAPRDDERSLKRVLRVVLALACVLFCSFLTQNASAEVLQVPYGAKPISLQGRVGCTALADGWTYNDSRTSVRPPASADSIGQALEISVANDAARCAKASAKVTLLVTDRFPIIDNTSVALAVDDARLEVRGRNLNGLGVAWHTPSASGGDTCRDPKSEGGQRQCLFAVGRNLPADPSGVALSWVPAGGRTGADVVTFDLDGNAMPPETFVLTPARIVLSRLISDEAVVDLSTGVGEIKLSHPEAASAAECSGATCSLAGGKILVRGQTSLVNTIELRVRLVPHVYVKKGENLESQTTLRLSVLHCPMSVASGMPLRGVDSAHIVVKFEGRCAKDVGALHFFAGSTPLDVVRVQTDGPLTWVVLRLGNVDASKLSVTAVRGDLDDIPIAVARTEMRSPPAIRTSLEIPGYPNLNFIPNNREASVHVGPVGDGGMLVLEPIEGVYSARVDGEQMWVQGDPYASGLTGLRFGYRSKNLPPALGDVDLAVLTDPLQRPIREANIPAPIDVAQRWPFLEVVCADEKGKARPLIPGETAHLPYSSRDTCRFIVHRERLRAEYGTQKLAVEIDVLRPDGSPRSEGHVSQTLVVRAGREPRVAWIHGISTPFDRIVVRVAHVADEAHYVGASELLTGPPALKWTAILGTGHLRLYATTTIPTGLYRFGDAEHSGVLSLNFGVISRLTWLDSEGQEGFLGLEGGLMVIGLAGSESTTGNSLTQVGAVAGIGFSVPIANKSGPSQASINLHGWYEHDIEAAGSDTNGRRWSIIFGPSISIGNIGANL